MISKNIYDEDSVLIIIGIIILACFIFFLGKMKENSLTLSRDEVCQKHFWQGLCSPIWCS